jgi:uncharacterized protein YutE (UPF0331/DUF86 family)
MIDLTLVTRKMALILEDLADVSPLSGKGSEEFVGSRLDEILAERLLERMIGRMIDINFHLITESGHRPPSDYYQSFLELGRLGILPPAMAEQMAACAGLRNRIVHEYDDVDPRKIHEALRTALRDIPEYLGAIRRFLDARPTA